MDTKEKRPASDRRKRPAGTRRTGKKTVPDRRRRKAAAAAPRRAVPRRRVIRGPKEEIPNAVYTLPKPIRKGKLLLRLGTVVAVVVALMMAVSIFFKVETITVLGANHYTAWDVREASGIEVGDGLLTLSRARAAGKIQNTLDYVDEVKIDIELPGTVRIEITELQVTYAVQSQDDTWWLIDSDGRAIEKISATAASGYTRIQGVTVKTPETGETVTAATDAQKLETALAVAQSLESNGVFGEAAYVNVEDLTDICLQHGERFEVRLGDTERLDYKIGYMVAALASEEMEYQMGVLDVSFAFSEEAIFTPAA